MKIIEPGYKIESLKSGSMILRNIERYGRTCYKSEDLVTFDSSIGFVKKILNHKPPHLSIIEHEGMTVRFFCNRGFTHELVRHRLCSFSQESTRYCNYSKDKFDNQVSVIRKSFQTARQLKIWVKACESAEKYYLELLAEGVKPQDARDVLPICLKTEIVITANLRQWGHIFYQRTSPAAHLQMRELMCPLLDNVRHLVPIIFDDLSVYAG